MANSADAPFSSFLSRLRKWSHRVALGQKLAIAVVSAAVVFGIATYLVLADPAPVVRYPQLKPILFVSDLSLLAGVAVVVATGFVRIWVRRRAGAAGSRMHTRIVALFSLVAVLPAVIVAGFSALFMQLALETLFSAPISTAVQESVAVAEAYVGEYRKTIQADVLRMAADLNHDAARLMSDPAWLNQALNLETQARALSEAVLIDRFGHVLARSGLAFAPDFEKIPASAFEKADAGDVVILTQPGEKRFLAEDRVRALVRLDNFIGDYLYVDRSLEPEVLSHLARAQEAAQGYRELESKRSSTEINFAVVFFGISLLLLLSSIAFGLAVATRLVRPISGMIDAAERVRGGDLTARVVESDADDEMTILGRAFNRMTAQLQSQRGELIDANQQLDQRRRFTEAVLAGVSAGVIGLDAAGRIHLPNPSATRLLGTPAHELADKLLAEAVPEMAGLLIDARERPGRPIQAQVNLTRGGVMRNLLVAVVTEMNDDEIQGFVVTFDDITQLVSAQRTAAWADVARRIAHEIKNPLTPIQLSAERLKRKYMKEIVSDPEVFTKCTDTIIRQVGDIGRMVDEFSSFARLPAPVFRTENLAELVRQALFLQHVAHAEVDYVASLPEGAVPLRCDARQLAQVMTNLLQNAADSIDARRAADAGAPRGRIEVRLLQKRGEISVEVIDNGRGLPVENRSRLTEPYVTTRTKGTGLGLAIVKKIMEEHAGELLLDDAEGGGACIRLLFRTAAGEADGMMRERAATGGENAEVVAMAGERSARGA
ncbi:MAG TPA: PAS domain-containing sensor histidine kinase [Candidatus Sulfotelmatobacter sp.]|nr:PAS domain-containing sensor histidine kinase [Candidatus Sulfotelmatobacter sp.]